MKNLLLPSLDFAIPFEVEIHYKRPLFDTMIKISKSLDAEKTLRKYINPNRIDHKEFFWVMLLDNANHLLAIANVGTGSQNSVHINIKEIFQLALKTNAQGIILAHNHPSGRLVASSSDIKFTEKIQELAELLTLTLLDHIIITSESYLSFADTDLM